MDYMGSTGAVHRDENLKDQSLDDLDEKREAGLCPSARPASEFHGDQ